MSYISDTLEPGELTVYQARISPLAYLGALLFFIVTFMPGQITSLLATELTLTDKRVIGKTGMFYPKSIAAPYGRIELAKVQHGLLGWMAGYGSLTIRTKSGTQVKFRGIAHPLEIQRQIDEAIELTVLGRKLSDFEKAPLPVESAAPKQVKSFPAVEAPKPKREERAYLPARDKDVW